MVMISMNRFDATLHHLFEETTENYYLQPIPCDLDGRIREFIRNLRAFSDEERSNLSSRISFRHSDALLMYSERMASLTIRYRDLDAAVSGLDAISILNDNYDYRDVLMVLSVLEDSVNKMGSSMQKLLCQAIEVKNPGLKALIKDFLARDPESKTLDKMGYVESSDEDGFCYRRAWL